MMVVEITSTAIINFLGIVMWGVDDEVTVFTAVCSRSYHGALGVRSLDHLSFTATVLTELIVAFFILIILA